MKMLPNTSAYDWDKVMNKKEKIVGSLTKGIEGLFKKNKVDYVKGYGSFSSANTIITDNGESISAKNVIIATGSEPAVFPGFEFDEH
jgi:dihydrolipoamide dehydrogenase